MTIANQGHRTELSFRHEVVDAHPPSDQLGICLVEDLTGNGRDDIIVGGGGPSLNDRTLFIAFGKRVPTLAGLRWKLGLGDPNIYWYENPGWQRHDIGTPPLGVGAALGDISENGRVDIVAGQGIHHNDVYWFEQPRNPWNEWKTHRITSDFEKYHDIGVGDVDGDGEPEVVGLSQESETVFYYDIPDDPSVEPWPTSSRHVVADGINVEGLYIGDVDGDGQAELVAGTNIFRRRATGWTRESILDGWDDVRVTADDVDGDGRPELIFTEGDSPTYGTHPGRLAIVDTASWNSTILKDGLFCPHSVQTADFTGNDSPDIFVGEMGLGENDDPKHYIFVNDGHGSFDEHVIARGIPTHEAKAADMTGNGIPDIVGKSYSPDCRVDVLVNER